MAEYIDREELETALNFRLSTLRNKIGYYEPFIDGFYSCVKTIENIPAADVAPVKHGKWMYEERENSLLFWIHCSVCGWKSLDQSVSLAYHYCPVCGAKMDGGEKENE